MLPTRQPQTRKTVLTLPRFGQNAKYNICLATLVGIPGAGKTTFVEKLKELDRTHQLIFSIVHICYDDFILIDDNFEAFGMKLFKWQRKVMLKFVKRLLRVYTAKKCQSKLYAQARSLLKNERIKLTSANTTKNNILFIIDDNMYYRSMRNEYVNICRQLQVGYFQIFFDCGLDVALERNSNRSNKTPLPDEVIRRMSEKLEKPNPEYSWEKDYLTVTPVYDIEDHVNRLNDLVAMKIMTPEHKRKKIKVPEAEKLNQNEAIELLLRKEIHRRLEILRQEKTEAHVFRSAVDELNARKRFVRQKLKNKTFPMPENLEDVIDLLDTELFQAENLEKNKCRIEKNVVQCHSTNCKLE
jgi:tRNA uridine 5-carbamoylmethylation protein Kti12